MKRSGRIGTYQLCLTAMAVAVNIAGGQIALLLRLPVYLDSIGTILIGALLGPWMGMIPNLLSGILVGMTVDIYSRCFAPVGMVTGLMSGLLMGGRPVKGAGLFLTALGVAVPGTLVSSLINAVLFGGITSSGSAVLVQLLSRTPLGLTGSIFAVQILTDYADRCISIFAVSALAPLAAAQLRGRITGE